VNTNLPWGETPVFFFGRSKAGVISGHSDAGAALSGFLRSLFSAIKACHQAVGRSIPAYLPEPKPITRAHLEPYRWPELVSPHSAHLALGSGLLVMFTSGPRVWGGVFF